MATPAFDTHKAVKALCNAGFNGDQAEAVVEQINGAVNENVATKSDLAQLVHREEFSDELKEAVSELATKEAVARLATKEEIARLATKEEIARLATKEETARLATKEELREAVSKLATKEELREAVSKLATKEEIAKLATKEELEKLELRLLAQMQKQANTYLKYLIVFAAAVVGLSKMLDILIG